MVIEAQDQRISEAFEEERPRLRRFIQARVADVSEADDILQEVFYEFVEAYRMLKPVERAGAWLFQVARNRIVDLFRKKKPVQILGEDGQSFEDLLPSPDAGPDALYARRVLLDELDAALDELPDRQRAIFEAHEIEGKSFREISAETGVSVNTLLSRKHSAVLHLRKRLQSIYGEYTKR